MRRTKGSDVTNVCGSSTDVCIAFDAVSGGDEMVLVENDGAAAVQIGVPRELSALGVVAINDPR